MSSPHFATAGFFGFYHFRMMVEVYFFMLSSKIFIDYDDFGRFGTKVGGTLKERKSFFDNDKNLFLCVKLCPVSYLL